MDSDELVALRLGDAAGAGGDVLPEIEKIASVNGNPVDHPRMLSDLIEDPSGQILSPILHTSETPYDRLQLKQIDSTDDIEIDSTVLDNYVAEDHTGDVLNVHNTGEKHSEEQELDRKSTGSKTLEVAVNIVSSRSESTQGSEGFVNPQERMNDFGFSDPVKVLVNFPEDIMVTCKATLRKLDSDENLLHGEKPDVEPKRSDDKSTQKSTGTERCLNDNEDVVDFVHENFESYNKKIEQHQQFLDHFLDDKKDLTQYPYQNSLKSDNFLKRSMSDGVRNRKGKGKVTENLDSEVVPVTKSAQLTKSMETKYTQSNVDNLQWATVNDEVETSISPNKTTKTRGVSVGINSPKSCCAKGHICFDCFPIPDELLNQIHQQTGMNRLLCLQAAQTVVKYFKADLVSSNYFSYEENGEYSNESSFEADGYTLLTPTKVGNALQSVQVQTNDTNEKPAWGLQKLSKADQFKGLVQQLKTEKNSWRNSKNVSHVFAFLRSFNKVMTELDRSVLKRLILKDNYEFLSVLTTLLQKEDRWSVQWEILGILGIVASRDSKAKRKLIETNLPVLLSKEILHAEVEPSRLAAYAELLTVLFTTGTPLPIYLMEEFGVKFVVSILDMIESEYSEPGWALPDALIKLLLAYNLQFSSNDVYDNLTIHAIARIDNFKTLTNRLVDFLEREDNPLTHWEANVSIHQCVVKMITDVYLCRTTAHIFTVTQSIIIIRNLTKGLPTFLPGDKRRTAYLKLIRAALHHCKYDYIRFTPSLANLQDILLEEASLSSRDQEVIRSIFKSFPNLRQ